jgi:hypothetical protein
MMKKENSEYSIKIITKVNPPFQRGRGVPINLEKN